MSFYEDCINLDKNQMNRPVKYHKTMNGIEPVIGIVHYVCQREENFGWISNCPTDCPFRETK
jgi:hypothetical protein